MDPFRKYIITQIIKQTGKIPRADTVLSNKVAQLKMRIKNMGVDISKVTDPKEITKHFNMEKSWFNQILKQKAKNLGLMDPNKNIFMKKGPFEGFTPKIVPKSKYKDLSKKTIERIKRKRYEKALKEERIKSAKDEFYLPKIIDPDDFLADGGIAGMLGEGPDKYSPKNFYALGIGPVLQDYLLGERPVDEEGFHTTLNKEDLENLLNLLKEESGFEDIKDELMFRFGRVNPEKKHSFHLGLGKDKAEIGFKKQFAGGGIAGMLGEPTYADDNHRVPLKWGKRPISAGMQVLDPDFDDLDPDEWLEIIKSAKSGAYGAAEGGRVPLSWGGFLMKLLQKSPSKLESLKDFTSKREFILSLIGQGSKQKNKRMMAQIKEEMEKIRKNPPFKFADTDEIKKEVWKELTKGITKHAEGGRVPLALGRGTEQAIAENKALEERLDFFRRLDKFQEDKAHGKHMTPMPDLFEGPIQRADRPPPDPELQVGPFIPEEEIYVEFDDGTIYYKDTGEFYNQEGEQVDSPSKGAKPVVETMEAAAGGRVPLKGGKTPFKPPLPDENILEGIWKNMGPWEKLLWGIGLLPFEKGGRVGLWQGGLAAALRFLMQKYGKDVVKLAKDVKPSKKWDTQKAIQGFLERNPQFKNKIVDHSGYAPKAGEGRFTKAEAVIMRLENTIKGAKGKTDKESKYVLETFPNWVKEIKADPKLANNRNVWDNLMGGLPKNQQFVVYGDDTVDFFTQSKFGPHNIASKKAFHKKHPYLTEKEATKISTMEPTDQVMELKRLQTLRTTKHAEGGIIGLNAGGPLNTQALIQLYMSEGMTEEEATAAANASSNLPWNILTDKAEGGRVPMWLGGGLGAGKGLLRLMLKYFSKGSKHGKSPTEMLKLINPKQWQKHLDDLRIYQVSKHGISAPQMIKEFIKKTKKDRTDTIEEIIASAKNIKKADDNIIAYKKQMIDDMAKKGVDKNIAETFAEGMSKSLIKSVGPKGTPKVTEKGLLELQNIHKNIITKGRPLNAEGGLATMLGE